MDNPGYNNDENRWVEERIARLSPPQGWKPDTDQAFERVMQRAKPAAMRPVIRLSMAGATIAVIGLVVVLLPWKALWTPKVSETSVAAQQTAPPAKTNSETPEVSKAPAPAPQPPGASAPTPAETQAPPSAPPQPAQDAKPPLRPKKEPRIIARVTEEPQKEPAPSIAQAQGQQAQGQQTPPSGVTQPAVIYQVQPAYTPEAREARVQGTIEIVATVREDGTVKVERITRGLGYGLDEAATAAVEQWKFIPGKKDGQPVAVTTNILINFSLK
jgi:protein TonB